MGLTTHHLLTEPCTCTLGALCLPRLSCDHRSIPPPCGLLPINDSPHCLCHTLHAHTLTHTRVCTHTHVQVCTLGNKYFQWNENQPACSIFVECTARGCTNVVSRYQHHPLAPPPTHKADTPRPLSIDTRQAHHQPYTQNRHTTTPDNCVFCNTALPRGMSVLSCCSPLSVGCRDVNVEVVVVAVNPVAGDCPTPSAVCHGLIRLLRRIQSSHVMHTCVLKLWHPMCDSDNTGPNKGPATDRRQQHARCRRQQCQKSVKGPPIQPTNMFSPVAEELRPPHVSISIPAARSMPNPNMPTSHTTLATANGHPAAMAAHAHVHTSLPQLTPPGVAPVKKTAPA